MVIGDLRQQPLQFDMVRGGIRDVEANRIGARPAVSLVNRLPQRAVRLVAGAVVQVILGVDGKVWLAEEGHRSCHAERRTPVEREFGCVAQQIGRGGCDFIAGIEIAAEGNREPPCSVGRPLRKILHALAVIGWIGIGPVDFDCAAPASLPADLASADRADHRGIDIFVVMCDVNRQPLVIMKAVAREGVVVHREAVFKLDPRPAVEGDRVLFNQVS